MYMKYFTTCNCPVIMPTAKAYHTRGSTPARGSVEVVYIHQVQTTSSGTLLLLKGEIAYAAMPLQPVSSLNTTQKEVS